MCSVKIEHHEGKGTRLIPIFPELRPYLEAVWEEAEPGTEYVITRYRDANANLRTQLQRIIRRAGLKSWPKLWQNLRASRATELANEYPAHVAAGWGIQRWWPANTIGRQPTTTFPRQSGAAQKASQQGRAKNRTNRPRPRDSCDFLRIVNY